MTSPGYQLCLRSLMLLLNLAAGNTDAGWKRFIDSIPAPKSIEGKMPKLLNFDHDEICRVCDARLRSDLQVKQS